MIYHVLNRGVLKRDIVRDDQDRARFVHDLFVFNDKNPVDANHRFSNRSSSERQLLVHIYAWCLMNNHYHLLVSPVDDDTENVSLFMKKLNGGYAKYFNEKYEVSGYVWQGKYKKIEIQQDGHFFHIPYYIHCNPLDYTHKKWRTGSVANKKKALEELYKYRWSSFLDYVGVKNFPSVIHMGFLDDILGSRRAQESTIGTIISHKDKASGASLLE